SPEETTRATDMVRIAIPKVPIAVVALGPSRLVSTTDDDTMGTDRLRGANVLAIAAIGEPELFKAQLKALGAHVTLAPFRDHHTFRDADLRALAAQVVPGGFAVCT